MRRPVAAFLWACLAAGSGQAAAAEAPFELRDGDRVVLLGGTFIEREQSYGYIETLLTARFPDRDVTFRNLGWSGDTVRGEARSRFGPPAEGFAHLKEHVEALRPTLIFVCYGLNESYDGKPGLPAFAKDLNTLLDVLDKTGARVILITPRRLEKLPPPMPDPAEANARLADYVAVLKEAAAKRGYRVVDLYATSKEEYVLPLTDNEIHLNKRGYRTAAEEIRAGLGIPFDQADLSVEFGGRVLVARGLRVEGLKATPEALSFRLTLDHLPRQTRAGSDYGGKGLDDSPEATADLASAPQIRIGRIEPGTYLLRIDGRDQLEFAPDDKSGTSSIPLTLLDGPDVKQVNEMLRAVLAKNELYFHRWRPQNETYLFGFRKHEQGNNAREIPLFDPLVAEKEREIARLRVPSAHTYEIIRKPAGP